MGHQFAHIETCSVSGGKSGRTVSGVINEAGRVAGFCDHVKGDPLPPVVLSGMTPAELREFHDVQLAKAKRGRGKGNSLRKDSPTLLAAVFSFPFTPEDKLNPKYLAFRDDTIAFFKREMESRGGEVLSVVQHEDEKMLHVHVFAMKLDDPRFAVKKLHRGHVAAAPVQAAGGKGVIEYCDAMRGFQDSYYDEVAKLHGMTRHGRRRQRLSRGDYRTQEREAALMAERYKALDGAESLVDAALTKAAAAETAARQAEAVPKAFAAGVTAWCDGELDDRARPAAHLPILRKMSLTQAIQPAAALLTMFVKAVAAQIAKFSEAAKVEFKSELRLNSQEIAKDFTSPKMR